MLSLARQLRAMGNDDALRLVASLRPQLFAKVKMLRDQHLAGARSLLPKSMDSYRADAERVGLDGDPMDSAGTAASFRKLRAACIWSARERLKDALLRADQARKQSGNELASLCIYNDELPAIERRLAFLAESKFDPARAARKEKTHQQRSKLGRLPSDWIERAHNRTKRGKYGLAVAVGALCGARPAEIEAGVRVRLDGEALVFEVAGAKVQTKGAGVASGVAIGQRLRVETLTAVGPQHAMVFAWLKERVKAAGGHLAVGEGLTAAGISSAFCSMSAREFPGLSSPPSFYALRHTVSAELKASGIGVEAVAKGMGHASSASQSAYGVAGQGSGGFKVSTWSSGAVRMKRQDGSHPSRAKKATAKLASRLKARRGGPS